MKQAILFIVVVLVFGFLYVQMHENTHERQFEIMGCEQINKSLFKVIPSDCPYRMETAMLQAELESQYLDIMFYTIVTTLLIMILFNVSKLREE